MNGRSLRPVFSESAPHVKHQIKKSVQREYLDPSGGAQSTPNGRPRGQPMRPKQGHQGPSLWLLQPPSRVGRAREGVKEERSWALTARGPRGVEKERRKKRDVREGEGIYRRALEGRSCLSESPSSFAWLKRQSTCLPTLGVRFYFGSNIHRGTVLIGLPVTYISGASDNGRQWKEHGTGNGIDRFGRKLQESQPPID